jgi:hypothetical protein
MARVYKYPLKPEDVQVLEMPKDAKVLDIQVQQGIPCIWAIVDPDAPMEIVKLYTYGTGHNILNVDKLLYLGTYQILGGEIVFHVFRDYTYKAVTH